MSTIEQTLIAKLESALSRASRFEVALQAIEDIALDGSVSNLPTAILQIAGIASTALDPEEAP